VSGWLILLLSAVCAIAFGVGVALLEDWIRGH
jgi:hypothetical protein